MNQVTQQDTRNGYVTGKAATDGVNGVATITESNNRSVDECAAELAKWAKTYHDFTAYFDGCDARIKGFEEAITQAQRNLVAARLEKESNFRGKDQALEGLMYWQRELFIARQAAGMGQAKAADAISIMSNPLPQPTGAFAQQVAAATAASSGEMADAMAAASPVYKDLEQTKQLLATTRTQMASSTFAPGPVEAELLEESKKQMAAFHAPKKDDGSK
jgi:hypothetical protein